MARREGRQGDIWAQAAFYAGLGFILPGGLAAGYFFGWVLDRWLHTAPFLALIMAVVGAAGGFIEVLKLLSREEKSEQRKRSDPPV
jgi:F0F1-type ATP synthase assembly protein I